MPSEEDCSTGSGFTQNSRGSTPGVFPETRWSLILRAGGLEGSRADTAWNEIGRIYWYPIYSYIRRWGKRPEEAEDITQLLFYEFVKKGSLEGADPARGRFRSYALRCAKNLMINEERRQSAQKRGGGQPLFSFDAEEAEARYVREPVEDSTPETLFDRACAIEFMSAALRQLESEYRQRGSGAVYDRLSPFLSRRPSEDDYRSVCEDLEMPGATARSHLHRLRKRFFKHFRDEVTHTLEDPGQAEEEIGHLLAALGQPGLMRLTDA